MKRAGDKLGRFEILGHLGAGGMGVVYRARDPERDRVVALKTLHRLDPGALMRLKSEFRQVANVTHPGLVALYELGADVDAWFFTMEYIEGRSLKQAFAWHASTQDTVPRGVGALDTLDVERPPLLDQATLPSAGGDGHVTTTRSEIDDSGGPAPHTGLARLEGSYISDPLADTLPFVAPRPLMELSELRRVFRELAQGVACLHAAGMVHCDIKPANVMLGTDGRVVLLDFGLASQRHRPPGPGEPSSVAGTPAYMAPEQAEGRPATEASDWYAFGVLLYEALSATLPFSGEASAVLEGKRVMAAPPLPVDLVAPDDLRSLCMSLLAREPGARPAGGKVLAALGATPSASVQREPSTGALAGREDHLRALTAAYEAVASGESEPSVVHVHGASGMGKSALLERFLGVVGGGQQGATVLYGRCYERESVPYKAFDSLVDSLTRHLRGIPEPEVSMLLPQHVTALARLFPVLQRVDAIANAVVTHAAAPRAAEQESDRQELRHRAFRALRELLSRLARRGPLVLAIDDLQWGDRDSGALLGELLSPPRAPRLLMICAYRTEEAEASPFLRQQRRFEAAFAGRLDVRKVEVGPLPEGEAAGLARQLLVGVVVDEAAPARIARESQGNPFFIEELVGLVREGAPTVSLDRVVMSRVALLPPDTRRLLELVAVAGRPTAQGITLAAAELGGDVQAAMTQLRAARMVRTGGIRDEDPIEAYHDQVRQSVYAGLPPDERAQHHLRLAEAFEAAGPADPELLFVHYLAAGDSDKAGSNAALAGDRAASALAFEQAAHLYREAVACLPQRVGLRESFADALVNAGELAEAAPVYLQAAARTDAPRERARLERRAAEQYLTSGNIEEGVRVLLPLLKDCGLKYPRSPKTALFGLIGRMLQLQIRGTTFEPLPADACAPAALNRIDTCWTAGKGLGSIDIMRGGYFLVRAANLALKAREPRRISRGLSHVGLLMIARGVPKEAQKGAALQAQAEAIARDLDDPHLIGFALTSAGTARMTQGRWAESARLLAEGTALLEDQCTGVAWECSFARAVLGNVLRLKGDIRDLEERGRGWLRNAEAHGDRYGGVWLRLHLCSPVVAADDPERATAELTECIRGWEAGIFTPQHILGIMLLAECDLYRGEPQLALDRFAAAWKVAHDSFAMGWQVNRVLSRQVRANAHVMLAAAGGRDADAHRAAAARDAKAMVKEGPPYGLAAAAVVRAGLSAQQGAEEQAVAELRMAAETFEAAAMSLYAASARRRLGSLLGGDEGDALITQADAAMAAQGVQNPARWAAMYAAGRDA